jgi:hypothetical protein
MPPYPKGIRKIMILSITLKKVNLLTLKEVNLLTLKGIMRSHKTLRRIIQLLRMTMLMTRMMMMMMMMMMMTDMEQIRIGKGRTVLAMSKIMTTRMLKICPKISSVS